MTETVLQFSAWMHSTEIMKGIASALQRFEGHGLVKFFIGLRFRAPFAFLSKWPYPLLDPCLVEGYL